MYSYVNSVRQEDYLNLNGYPALVQSTFDHFNTAGARLEMGHEHRLWEYGSALKMLSIVPRRFRTNLKILDVGSGYSPLGPTIALLFSDVEVTECEPNPDMVASRQIVNKALELRNMLQIKVLNQGLENLPNEEYDLVTCISVLEHVDPKYEVQSWHELLKRVAVSGILFITVDCVPEKKPYGHYYFDNLRQTNFTPSDLKARFDLIVNNSVSGLEPTKSFESIGEPDWTYWGDEVHNYSFFRLGFRRTK